MLPSFPSPHFFRALLNPKYNMIWAFVVVTGPQGCGCGIGWTVVALVHVLPGGKLAGVGGLTAGM